jgi:hypothetical protein
VNDDLHDDDKHVVNDGDNMVGILADKVPVVASSLASLVEHLPLETLEQKALEVVIYHYHH